MGEESTSADDSLHALNDATDSDVDDAIASDLIALRSQVSLEQGASSSEGAKTAGREDRPRPEHTNATWGSALLHRQEVRHSSSIGPPIHHEVPVGVKHTFQYPIVRKVIGPGGEHMKNISNACPGTKVELRGAGTNPWSGGESGPLVLHIRGHDAAQCAEALKLAHKLIAHVREDHQRFLDSRASRST